MPNCKRFLFLGSILLFIALLLTFSPMRSGTAHAAASPHTLTTTAAAPLISCYPPTIGYGSTGTWVKNLQLDLNADYRTAFSDYPYQFYPYSEASTPLKVDGIFGSDTESAVKDFQWANGLQVDGIVGPHTWLALGYCMS